MTTIANARSNMDRTPNVAVGQHALDVAVLNEINRLEAMIKSDNREQALAHLAEIQKDLMSAMKPTPGVTRVIGQDGVNIVNPHRVIDPTPKDAGSLVDTGKPAEEAKPATPAPNEDNK